MVKHPGPKFKKIFEQHNLLKSLPFYKAKILFPKRGRIGGFHCNIFSVYIPAYSRYIWSYPSYLFYSSAL